MNLQLRNILKRPQKKQPDEKRPEGFLDPEDEKACEVVRGAFNLLFEGSGVRIFTASHLDLSHRWVPFLGKSDIVILREERHCYIFGPLGSSRENRYQNPRMRAVSRKSIFPLQ